MRTVCKFIVGFYIAACIASLVIIPLNAAGMAGEPDPLSGVFAALLAAPWIWLTVPMTSDSTAWNMLVAGSCMALNVAILRPICSWIADKSAPRDGG